MKHKQLKCHLKLVGINKTTKLYIHNYNIIFKIYLLIILKYYISIRYYYRLKLNFVVHLDTLFHHDMLPSISDWLLVFIYIFTPGRISRIYVNNTFKCRRGILDKYVDYWTLLLS